MKIIDYKLTCDISCLFEKKIFIYGTGKYGNKVATVFLQMEIEIEGFCETNPKKNEFFRKKILPIKTLIEDYDESNVLVIIASEKYYKEMIYELRTVENMLLCTYYALFISLYLNYEIKGTNESLKNCIKIFNKISVDRSVEILLRYAVDWYCILLSQPTLVLLYQPGKVASKTISQSSSLEILHLHSLAYAFNVDGNMSDVCNDVISKFKENPIKIITGVREPIARDISVLFESTEGNIWPLMNYGHCLNYLFGDYSRNKRLNVQELKKRVCIFEKSLNYSFNHLSKEISQNKADEFSWFDYEIKALFGVDIYAYPFDREKGYAVIEQDNICILVYKCEKLNQLEDVISEFLGEPGFSLENTNQGKEKIYSYVYKEFKENIKLNKQYFDYYYSDNSRLKHFYTDTEIKQFKDKWEKRLQ